MSCWFCGSSSAPLRWVCRCRGEFEFLHPACLGLWLESTCLASCSQCGDAYFCIEAESAAPMTTSPCIEAGHVETHSITAAVCHHPGTTADVSSSHGLLELPPEAMLEVLRRLPVHWVSQMMKVRNLSGSNLCGWLKWVEARAIRVGVLSHARRHLNRSSWAAYVRSSLDSAAVDSQEERVGKAIEAVWSLSPVSVMECILCCQLDHEGLDSKSHLDQAKSLQPGSSWLIWIG